MEELKNEDLLFDDRELDELNNKITEISPEEKQDLEEKVEKYFEENEIQYEE